jgi:transcriptional regulator with XRE-family HTH domain
MPKTIRSPRQKKLQRLLIALRKEAGLTQTAVAGRLKRPQSFVAKYEGGERRLDVIEFLDVAHALGADPQEIIASLQK